MPRDRFSHYCRLAFASVTKTTTIRRTALEQRVVQKYLVFVPRSKDGRGINLQDSEMENMMHLLVNIETGIRAIITGYAKLKKYAMRVMRKVNVIYVGGDKLMSRFPLRKPKLFLTMQSLTRTGCAWGRVLRISTNKVWAHGTAAFGV
jgi:hypothetical protein